MRNNRANGAPLGRHGCLVMLFVPIAIVGLSLLTACDFRAKDKFQICELLPTQAAVDGAQKAWGALKPRGAMIAFGVNKGVLTSDIAKLIEGKGKWPPEAWAKLYPCMVDPGDAH